MYTIESHESLECIATFASEQWAGIELWWDNWVPQVEKLHATMVSSRWTMTLWNSNTALALKHQRPQEHQTVTITQALKIIF